MTSNTLKLFEPLFIQDGLIITQAFYLPTGTDWSSISDAYALNPLQSYVLYSAFDDAYIGAVTGDLSAITGPKMYAKIYSNTSAIQPYVDRVQFCSLPYTDEASRIMFDYLGHGSVGADESYREVRLKATLSSTNGAVTPELQSYRIKLK